MPWVADGVDGVEIEAAKNLITAAQRQNPDVFDALMAMSWVQDSVITADEAQAILQIRWSAGYSAGFSERMSQTPWVQDGITTAEASAMFDLAWPIKDAPALAEQMLNMPWVQDDSITDHEVTVTDSIYRVIRYAEAPALAERLLALPWVQDNITTAEARTIEGIQEAALLSPELAEKILQKPWVQDDITRDEGIIIHHLYRIARRTDESSQQTMVDVAIRIIDMPFLDDVTFAEARAAMSIYKIAGSRYRDSFQALIAHLKVQDGITDQEAKVIAVLRTATHYSPELIPHLLDGLDGSGGVYLEERIIHLPLTGETLLTIVRTQDQTTASMDYLEYSVRFAEKFMNTALPTNYVALYFGSLGPDFGANNWWTHMAMRQTSDGLEEYARTIAHEVGHYYTRSPGPTWLTEGSTYIFNIVAEYERTGYPLETHIKNRRCDSSVKTLPASVPDEHNGCARNLGERFFLDLYRTLGEDDFLQSFRALYRLRLGDNPHCDDTRECTDWNVHHVIEAFTTNVPEDVAAKAKEILLKWYGPLP